MKKAIVRVWVEEYDEDEKKPVREYGSAYEFTEYGTLAAALVGFAKVEAPRFEDNVTR